MNSSLAPAEGSFLLWTLGIVVYALGLHVGLVAVRLARRSAAVRGHLGLVLTAGLAWGTALCLGFLLGITGLPLPYTLGFDALASGALWLGGCLTASAGALLLVRHASPAAHVFTGVLLGALALALQAGWLASAGLRPGLVWRGEVLAAAGVLMVIGLAVACYTGLGDQATGSRLRGRWRFAATVLGTLAVLGGQEALLAGLNLPGQVGSVYRHQASLSLISLVGGALVPIMLAVAALDLRYRGRENRRRQRAIQRDSQHDGQRDSVLPAGPQGSPATRTAQTSASDSP